MSGGFHPPDFFVHDLREFLPASDLSDAVCHRRFIQTLNLGFEPLYLPPELFFAFLHPSHLLITRHDVGFTYHVSFSGTIISYHVRFVKRFS